MNTRYLSKYCFKLSKLSLLITGCMLSQVALSNPQGPQVISGQVSIDSSLPGTMNITNSPGAIINWQDFSIASDEITRFLQQSSQSTVLNRVIGGNPSQILGQLISNGQVLLINPNGIVFGADAFINTQGLLASTLAISDQDFLSGNYHFIAGSNPTDIINEGILSVGDNGNIILIAPNIDNNGLIQTEGGQIVLAAGEELTITSLDNPEIRYQVTAPDNEVLNLGQVLSHGGAIDLFAGTLIHSGEINSQSLTLDTSGNISIITHSDLTLTDSSKTTASGSSTNGNILLQSQTGTTQVQGDISATSVASTGGLIQILGERVGLFENTIIDASGASGGEILIGGDYRGENPDIQNASATYVDETAIIKANALTDGDGGRVIVWANDSTKMYGAIEAMGGSESGDGGFVETSAHYLDIGEFAPNVSAHNGMTGSWLLDPYNITVIDATGTMDAFSNPFTANADSSTISAGTIASALQAGGTVTIETNGGGTQAGNITVNEAISVSPGSNATLNLNAANNIYINANIEVADSANGINLNLNSNNDGIGSTGSINFDTASAVIALNGGTLTMNSNSSPNATVNLNANNLTFDDLTWNHQGIINVNGSNPSFNNLTWTNAGSLDWNASASTELINLTNTTFSNTGTFNDNSNSASSASIRNVSGSSITNSGTWNKLGSANTTIGTSFVNSGTVNIKNGTLTSSESYTQTGGQTTLNGGNLTYTGTNPIQLNGGSFTGSGTISGNLTNNSGVVAPGFSPGTLTISGNYVQGANGQLTMEIAGTTTGSYDRLIVTGSATLGGTLNIIPLAPYTVTPQLNDTFSFISATGGILGNFSSIVPSTGYSFNFSLLGSLYELILTAFPPTTVSTTISNNVITVQSTNLVTLTTQLELIDTTLVDDTDEEDPLTTALGLTDPAIKEVAGALMICY